MNPRPMPSSPRAAEKLGELGNPGFQATLFWDQWCGFFVVAHLSEGRQHVGEGRFLLVTVPRSNGKLNELMAHAMKPHHHHTVVEERHGCRPFDGLGETVGLFPEAHQLLAVFKRAFDRPAAGVGRKDQTRIPVELRAVKHLVGPPALEVADQNDRQQTVAAGFVVQGLAGFDGQSGMEAELIEDEFDPGLHGVFGPRGHAGQAPPFRARPPLFLDVRIGGRCRFVERCFGMDTADEMNILGQLGEHALAAVGAVAGDDESVVGKPGRRQFDEFDGQFRPGAMVRIGLGGGGFGPTLLSFRQPLAIAIEPRGDGEGEDLGGRPARMDNDDANNDLIMSQTDQCLLTARDEGIIMHAGAVEGQPASATERVIHGPEEGRAGCEDGDHELGEYQ